MRRLRTRTKVLIGIVAVLVLGVGPAWAYWTAQDPLPSSPFALGNLDIQLDGSPNNLTSAITVPAAGLFPGQSVAALITVNNAGKVPLTYWVTAKGLNAGTPDLVSSLQLKVTTDSAVTGTGAAATCPGTNIATKPTVPATDSEVVSSAASRRPTSPLAATTGSEPLCFQLTLAATAPNSLQGASATVTFTFHAEQVAQP